MNGIDKINVKEAPIWTAQMLDMSKLKVLDKEYIEMDNTILGNENIPVKTKKVIVIYLG